MAEERDTLVTETRQLKKNLEQEKKKNDGDYGEGRKGGQERGREGRERWSKRGIVASLHLECPPGSHCSLWPGPTINFPTTGVQVFEVN